MSQAQLSPVNFYGDTIFVVSHQGQPFAPLKAIVESMGLLWAAQTVKLNSNKERWGVSIIEIPSSSGDQQTLCLPLRKLPAFFASINPKKVRPELRPKIELYQNECDDALWDYWMKGKAEREKSAAAAPLALPAEPYARLNTAQMQALRAAHRGWAEEVRYNGLFKSEYTTWLILKGHFGGVSRLTDLPAAWFLELVDFCHAQQRKEIASRLPRTAALPAAPQPAARPRATPPQVPEPASGGIDRQAGQVNRLIEQAKGIVHPLCRPGAFRFGLSGRPKATYDACDDAVSLVMCNLNAAQFALRIAQRLHKEFGTSFWNR